MAQRVGQSSNGTFIMIIDEDKCHANYARDIVSRHNFHVTVFTSPSDALIFLKNNAKDVAFILAAVDMQQLSGFQFLQAAREKRQDLQVIMMSAERTISTMRLCVQLGACFLVKKPLSNETVRNLQEYVNLKALRMEKINELLEDGTEEDDDEEMGEVNSNEAKNAKSVEVVSYEVGHGNTKSSNFDATEGNVHKTSSELFNEKVSRADGGSNSLGEQISYKIKTDPGVSKVSLVDYTDSEDDETKKTTST
uniref:Response regulatory domain-containing protein n=1 Tax=Leersia perrieri TaxID=77586 RepID=A0A0D9WE84_9ORYZ